ncbi:hypothetical protein BCR44DRAFT_203505 [Catenaria anguillulae PL171]|uniref:RRM domain-containing protein n=1 Tax=Catenaria anguillulae PL171 TaxID=765915 RepID=A0A1Y2HIK6_9FUNG|nr:hypothetical protein BCR44DRAFT_203505 [Catenaria anguillulae PL171]
MPSNWIVITSVSRYADEEKLRKLFAHVGEVQSIHVVAPEGSSPTSQAAIEFVKPDEARVAAHLNGIEFLDSILTVEAHRDEDQEMRISRTLRIDCVPLGVDSDKLRAFLDPLVDGIRRMRIGSSVDPETNLQYAYVEFSSAEHQMAAVEKLPGRKMDGSALRVSPSKIAISKGKHPSRPSIVTLATKGATASPRPDRNIESPTDRHEPPASSSSRRRPRSRSGSRQRDYRDRDRERERNGREYSLDRKRSRRD